MIRPTIHSERYTRRGCLTTGIGALAVVSGPSPVSASSP